jgi:copper chaperone CopZ
MSRFLTRQISLIAGLIFSASAFAADETVKHRITGLFAPEREADLRVALESLSEIKLVSVDFEHGEATFTYDPAVAFKGTKPAEIIKNFDERLRSASRGTLGVQPLLTTPKEQLTRVEIPVFGLDCKGCALAAYEAVGKLEGVAQATVDLKQGRVTALIDPAKASRATLEEALKKKGVGLSDK